MRCLKWITVGALVFVLTAPALGLTIPSIPDGVTHLKSRNQDMGTFYGIVDGGGNPVQPTQDYDITDPDSLPYAVADGTMIREKPTDANPQQDSLTGELEDSWGIMLLYQIGPGKIVAGGQVAPDGSAYYDNSDGSEDTWLVGMFWGANDTEAVVGKPSKPFTFQDLDVISEHQYFEVWAVEKSQLNPPAGAEISLIDYKPGSRTADNRYTGWLDPASWAAGTYQKLLSGVSTYFQFTGQAYANQQFQGDTIVFFDIDENDATGIWNQWWGGLAILTDPEGNPADAYLSWDLDPSGQGWDTYSSDQGGVYVTVPEPLTMAGLMLGIGSLVGYIRRRR